jgi:hypothetical protein
VMYNGTVRRPVGLPVVRRARTPKLESPNEFQVMSSRRLGTIKALRVSDH